MLLLWVNRETLNACGMVQGFWVPRCSLTPLLSCGALPRTLRTLQARNPFPVKVRKSFRARLSPASVQLAEDTSLLIKLPGAEAQRHCHAICAGLAQAEVPVQQTEACVAANVPHPSGIHARLRPIAKAPQHAAQKPSDMLISRTGLFYCATFPSRPGLPSSREPLHLPLSQHSRNLAYT